MTSAHPDSPDWFGDAVADRADESTLDVDGCTLVVRSWGDRAAPGVVLVHGGGAHSHWWDHIAPYLARHYRVVAFDLSGHGDSGRRPRYGMTVWSTEVNAVVRSAGFAEPPVLIGHSMGGRVAVGSASVDPDYAGVVVVDTPLLGITPEQRAAVGRVAFGPLRTYDTREHALARFRPVPDQPTVLPYVLDYIAEHSLVAANGGWQWKFDPAIFTGDTEAAPLTPLTCRAMMFGAEYGLVGKYSDRLDLAVLGDRSTFVEIPRASHHIMLDEPRALVASLLTVLAMWEH